LSAPHITPREAPSTAGGTIARAVYDAARRFEAEGIDDARLEAELLLAHALGVSRGALLARLADVLSEEATPTFAAYVRRRRRREPSAFITGSREFYGMDLRCAPGALIPRPETELLVDLTLAELHESGDGARVADVGTGTGAVACAVAAHAPATRVVATDASAAALRVARQNIERHGLADRVALVRTDLLRGLGRFDVIVANLPYVTESAWAGLAPEIRGHEPRQALVAGPSGTEAIERLLAEAPAHLAPSGALLAEIGESQAGRLRAAAVRAFPGAAVDVRCDLAGRDRALIVRPQARMRDSPHCRRSAQRVR